MRTIAAMLAWALALTGLAGASWAGDLPGADAAALWKYISQASPYQQWGQWPDYRGMHPGRSPHGDFVQIWVNPPALEASGPPLAAGSLIVKEGYGQDKTLTSITVMYKVPGYNPQGGDWFWAKYSPQGQPGPAGRPQGCVNCHASAAANDHVMARPLK